MVTYVQILVSVSVIFIWIFKFRFHCLDFFFGFAGVEFIVWISYQDVLMLIATWVSYLDCALWISVSGFLIWVSISIMRTR